MRESYVRLFLKKRLANTLANPTIKMGLGSASVIALLLFGLFFGGGVSLSGLGGTVSVSDIYFCLGRSNIYFVVTLGTQNYLESLGLWEDVKPRLRTAQAFVITANTHFGNIRDLSLDDKVFLIDEEGNEYPHVGQAKSLTTHHNTYLVFFPRYDMYGKPLFERENGKFDIVIRDVDFKERVFTFYYPLPLSPQGKVATQLDPTRIMMILIAVMAGLTLACAPCLFGALSVGSLTIGTTAKSDATVKKMKNTLLRNSLHFLAAFIASYMAIVVITATLRTSPEAFRTVEAIGGAMLFIFGLVFLRSWKPIARLEDALANFIMKRRPGFSKYVTKQRTQQVSINSKQATALGPCLSLVCSTAGAPTLSTSLVLPLMVYAGLSDLYWSLIIILVFLIAASLPFLLIMTGLGELFLTKAYRMADRLLVVNSLLLLIVGIILVLSPTTIINLFLALIRLLFYGGQP